MGYSEGCRIEKGIDYDTLCDLHVVFCIYLYGVFLLDVR